MSARFLPITAKEIQELGWDSPDIILVSGDAYVDHHSYGTAVIGRVLENAGYRVGIITQPDWHKPDAFMKLGKPKLFFGVTAGNLDSMVANYTANIKIRNDDDYAPGGKAHLRPDRATIIYTNRIREAFGSVPIVIGGVEASLRRLAHYDYWSDKVRRSILLDSKADLLIYGMGEKQVLDVARRLKSGQNIREINNIHGTVIVRNSLENITNYIEIPSFKDASSDNNKFNDAFRIISGESDPLRGRTIVQRHDGRFVIQLPPAAPLSSDELDRIYELNYSNKWHPEYETDRGVPGFEAVRFSIVSHRGCPGSCSFCTLCLHQGRIIQSRSARSILFELKRLSDQKDFKGTITDIGGPTANLYMADCAQWHRGGSCINKKCLMPDKCTNLKLGYEPTLALWKEAKKIRGIKHVFVGSGIRYDLLTCRESDKYLDELCAHHISGQLKAAPEHACNSVLDLMNKPHIEHYEDFLNRFRKSNERANKDQYLVNYFISAHPGSGLSEALDLALWLMDHNMQPQQVQDFIPLPMTTSSCMYYTEIDPFSGKRIYVAKGMRERKLQRALIQYSQPLNRKYIIEALRKLHRSDLMKRFATFWGNKTFKKPYQRAGYHDTDAFCG